ncbi:MAG: S8 family serine peptidase [Deltaproteobacteria bacterium]|jgi:autotransporter-associated beta strand protein|nr:S8 family serine peptidase [Deltaproteobacteria bacterium]
MKAICASAAPFSTAGASGDGETRPKHRPAGLIAVLCRRKISGMTGRALGTAALTAVFASILFCRVFAIPALGASPDVYVKTDEYMRNNGLDAINAFAAYALGYSGKGVTVAVIDSNADPGHPEFSTKNPYPVHTFIGSIDNPAHGVHVAGTLAASLNGKGMHGVAYAADLVALNAIDGPPKSPGVDPAAEAFGKIYSDYRFVTIINNSWGSDVSLASVAQNNLPSSFISEMEQTLIAMLPLASNALFVYAAENAGLSSPGFPAPLPSAITGANLIGTTVDNWRNNFISTLSIPENPDKMLRNLSLAIINVSAFDPGDTFNGIPAPDSDSIAFMGVISNMSDGAAHYTLLAPGMQIYSTVPKNGDEYFKKFSGTSMATPYVSGSAALVLEAFPWMNGIQLADTLLSTATHLNDLKGLPPFIIQLYNENGQFKTFSITLPQGVSASSIDLDDYQDELQRIFSASLSGDFDVFLAKLSETLKFGQQNEDPGKVVDGQNQLFPIHNVTDAQYLSLFGMGIVNAGKAVGGPGWLDANRLNNEDMDDTFQGNKFALYTVNTMGYDGVWTNDISEVRVGDLEYPISNDDPDAHGVAIPEKNEFNEDLEGLSVGLRKQGGGTLILTGNNGYLGPTFIEGGEIILVNRGTDTAALKGGVRIESGGVFGGNGTVGGNLYSSGLIVPGLADSTDSALTVNGKLESNGGTVRISTGNNGDPNKLIVGEAAFFENTVFEFTPLEGGAMPPSSYDVVQATGGIVLASGSGANTVTPVTQGVTLLHTYVLQDNGTILSIQYASSEVLPQAKSLSEGFLAGTALVNLGSDLVAGQGMNEAVKASVTGMTGGFGPGAFGAISIGQSRYNSGSHVDMKSISLLAGFSWGMDTAPGHLTLGVFFLYGTGDYDTYNSFGNYASVYGTGDVHHIGGGVLARMDFADTGQGHFYNELSGNTGRVHNEYNNSDLLDPWGRSAKYESSTAYYAYHLGVGYVWNISDKRDFEIFGKYFWTRQERDFLKLSTGDAVKFDDVNSSRLRLGGRFSCVVNDYVTTYLGAAWEHEFDGKVSASANGFRINAPSLRGDTGIGELGLVFRPSPAFPLSFNLNVQGYTGKRGGFSGGFKIRLDF